MQFPQDVKHLTCTPYNLWQTKCPCECCHTRHMRFPPEIEHVARCLVLYFCWKSPAWSRNIQNWHWSIEFIKQNLQNCFKVVFFLLFLYTLYHSNIVSCEFLNGWPGSSKRCCWDGRWNRWLGFGLDLASWPWLQHITTVDPSCIFANLTPFLEKNEKTGKYLGLPDVVALGDASTAWELRTGVSLALGGLI